jgi:hypothetical protein
MNVLICQLSSTQCNSVFTAEAQAAPGAGINSIEDARYWPESRRRGLCSAMLARAHSYGHVVLNLLGFRNASLGSMVS